MLECYFGRWYMSNIKNIYIYLKNKYLIVEDYWECPTFANLGNDPVFNIYIYI